MCEVGDFEKYNFLNLRVVCIFNFFVLLEVGFKIDI